MILSLNDAAFSYGGNRTTAVVSNINGRLDRGQGLALIGANGSGKTTLLRGILGEVPLVAGSVDNVAEVISYVPQVTDLDRTFPVTAYDVVGMGVLAELRPFQSLRSRRPRIEEALAKVGLAQRASVRFGNLSGGQQQRVLLARAIVARPQLVLLDEPFNGLDTENRAMLLNLLGELKSQGTAIVTSTHDLVLAEEVCEHTIVVGAEPLYGPTAAMVAKYVG